MAELDKKHDLKNLKLVVSLFIFILVLAGGLVGAWILSILKEIPDVDFADLDVSIAQTSIIVDSEGRPIDEVDPSIFSEKVSLKRVPKHVREAFLAVEDRSFYDHNGLDLRQIVASFAANMKSDDIERGASTITQQLVKNVYLSNAQSLDRKIQEAYLALGVERQLSKDAIFEAYLNRIDLGLGSQGIEAASQAYFSKHVEDLTPEEGALLAGVAKSPTIYQPLKRLPADDVKSENVVATRQIGEITYDLEQNDRAFERKNVVLFAMKNAGYLSQEEAEELAQKPIEFRPKEEEPSPYASYVADYIADEAIRILMDIEKLDRSAAEKRVREGGLTIHSTIESGAQRDLESLYDGYDDLIARGPDRGAHFLDFSTDEAGNIVDDGQTPLYLRYGNHFDREGNMHITSDLYTRDEDGLAVENSCFVKDEEGVLRLKNFYYLDGKDNLHTLSGGSTVFEPNEIEGDDSLYLDNSVLEKYADSIEEIDGELILSSDLFVLPDKGSLQPQSAAMITDNRTGAVIALVGGNDLSDPARLRFNHLHSKRQPGTALIPLTTYFTALAEGETLASPYDDTPLRIDGDIWPENSEPFFGYDILADALAHTRPAISGKILDRYGFEPIVENLKRLDLYGGDSYDDAIRTPREDANRHDFTHDAMASGNLIDGLSLETLVNSYSKIASPHTGSNHSIETIQDASGEVIYRHKNKKMQFPNQANILLRYGLKSSPLALKINEEGYDAFAVFGENKYNSDYFAVGATPRYTYGLWMGNELQKLPLSHGQTLAEDFYASLVKILDDQSTWEIPSSFEWREVSLKTGDLASDYAKRARDAVNLPFLPDTAPTEIGEHYTRKLICSESGDLASIYCPEEKVTYGYYFLRPEGYRPENYDGIVPKDYYNAPNRYCRIHTKTWYESMLEMQQALEEQEDDEDEEDEIGEKRNDRRENNRRNR